EIEDVMQDTYLAAFRHLDQFQGRARFATWLLKIGIHESFARLRRRLPVVVKAVDDATEETTFMNMAPARTPEQQASDQQLVHIVEAALDRLPTEQRQILMLRGVESLDTAEVADVLGLSEAAVKQRLHRARVMLQSELEGEMDGALSSAFGFLGARCDRIVERVMGALGETSQGVCGDCGAFSDLKFGDRWICETCYTVRGSCCTEFTDETE
ncbi:MAG TPA: sigma-70 family RNA polymerase sigma factor, partial [Polyangia bacterium]